MAHNFSEFSGILGENDCSNISDPMTDGMHVFACLKIESRMLRLTQEWDLRSPRKLTFHELILMLWKTLLSLQRSLLNRCLHFRDPMISERVESEKKVDPPNGSTSSN